MFFDMLVVLLWIIFIIGFILYWPYRLIRKYWKDRSYKKYWKEYDERQRKKEQLTKEAVCPHCGSVVLVDWGSKENICCYCNTEFDVYAARLIIRARKLLKQQQYADALDCYYKVLEYYPKNPLILSEISNVKTGKEDHVFIRTTVFHAFSKYETLEFRKHDMTYLKNNGERKIYQYCDMNSLEDNKDAFLFRYKDNIKMEWFATSVKPSIITGFIEQAKQGMYPPLGWKP